MKKLSFYLLTMALGIVCLASTIVFAQSEKVTIRMFPEPNQTVKMRMVQEMEMEITFVGGVDAGAAPMRMASKTVFAITQKVGAPNKEGHIESELTYDEVNTEMTMNGQPMQLGDLGGKFTGKKVTATFDKQGNLVSVKIPPEVGMPEETFKQLLKSFYGNLPTTPISVGEVVNTPLDFNVPIPVPGAGPLKMDGQVKYKLMSVAKEAGGRIAKFDQSVDGKMVSDLEVPSPDGQIKMRLDFKLNGVGNLVMNVDKGIVRTGDVKSTFGGKIRMAGGSSQAKTSDINLQGVMKVTITGGN